MDNKELKKKIAKILHAEYERDADEGNACLDCVEAGIRADQILQAFKEAGGAFLDPDQSLPESLAGITFYSGDYAYGLGQQDMLKANFRKIKEG